MNTYFADLIGYALEDITEFMANIMNGYVLLLCMLFSGMVVIIYFRFFRNAIKRGGGV